MPPVINITPHELQLLLQTGSIVLIDVREVHEFEHERIEEALNFPMSTFDPDEVLQISDGKEIVFQCRSGHRSAHAAEEFFTSDASYKHLDGGIIAWKINGGKTICT